MARQHPAALAQRPRVRHPQGQIVPGRARQAVAPLLTTLPRTSRGFLTLIPIRDGSLRLMDWWFVNDVQAGRVVDW